MTLLRKGVVEDTFHEDGEFISTFFLQEKKNNKGRTILNLKKRNESVKYYKFKMDTLQTILKLVKPNVYMATIDI